MLFAVESDKRVYELGDNLELRVKIVNRANSSIILLWCRDRHAVTLESNTLLVEPCRHSTTRMEVLSVAPGSLLTKIINLDLSGFKPGTYEVGLKYVFPSQNLHFSFAPGQIVFKQDAFSNMLEIELVHKICNSDNECLDLDCSGYGIPGAKGPYKPYCVNSRCKCMCYGCD